MLNKVEKNDSTTHKELLAVVFGTQIYRCYLYGQKYKLWQTMQQLSGSLPWRIISARD